MNEDLNNLAQPLIAYLIKNHHPHTAIVITEERVVVVEGVLSIPQKQEDFVKKLDCAVTGWD